MRLCIRAVDAGCSVLPIFLSINAKPAWVIALPKSSNNPNDDYSLVFSIIPIGFIIKKTPINPVMTAVHLMRPIFSPKINGDNKVTYIAELWAKAVVKPMGISCKDEKTMIIVTKPNNERANMLFQLFICKKSIFLARKAKIKRIGNE